MSAADHHQNLMAKLNILDFPSDFPYDFACNHDQEIARLSRRFSRCASLQEPSFTNFKEKRVFSGATESSHGWSVSSHSPAPSPPAFAKSDEDAWNLFYAAAGQVARMKIKMSTTNDVTGFVDRSMIGVSQHPPRSDGVELFRQQHFSRNKGASVSAWPPPLQHRPNQYKPPVAGGSGGRCDGGNYNTAAKTECAGTGVFLPRRYSDNPPESRKRQACWPANPPPRTTPQIQAHINGGFVSNYELLMGQRNKAMILAAQQQHRRRSDIDGVVMEPAANNPGVLLPQEWTY